jgi:uncharacterized protein (TIGR02452 family)
MKKTKEELKQVFNDTKRMCEVYVKSRPSTKKYGKDAIKLSWQYLKPKIVIENMDSVSAGMIYSKKGKTCILNMASEKKAGGGVENGEKAQEECLFRCSNLFKTVKQDFYPLEGDVALYTKNAVFVKGFDYNEIPWFKSDVVTVASVNLNANAKYDEETDTWIEGLVPKSEDYYDTMLDRIRLMCTLAADRKVDYLILGAWGCGVFKNNPNEVAELFYEVLICEGYKDVFKQVIFAIINDENSVGDNYDIFRKQFIIDSW